ncbi:flagellar filament capping protein FliD [Vreelandella aquamarina]
MGTISSLGVGSGLDLNGLLDQLRSAERQKLQPILAQKEDQQAKISGYGQIKSALTEFQTAVDKLNDPELYQGLSAEVTGDAVKATASSDASAGRYDVEVTQLARAGSLATNSIVDNEAELTDAGAEITITFGKDADNNDITQTIALDENSSLESIRDQINAFDFGDGPSVNASLVNDGSGYRLALNSTETGTDAGITAMAFTGIKAGNTLESDATTAYEARNAELSVNGIDIVSQSNEVDGAIEGVTLEVSKVTEAGSPNTVEVARNTLAVREAIGGFVNGYNELKDKITALTAFNGGGEAAGDLIGDRAARTIESELRTALSSSVPDGDFTTLSDIGISLTTEGKLEMDASAMSDVVANQQDAVAGFFASNDEEAGMAGQVGAAVDRLLGENGALTSAERGAEGQISSLDDRLERTERSIDRTVDRYRSQFAQLDGMIAQMNSTSGYLFQQLNMINSQMSAG